MNEDERLLALASYDILDTPPERGFDDLVALARDLCAAPIALVSLVDNDRQWFKARLGLPSCETDLDRSICRYVVRGRQTVVIADLATDSRTSGNPLVLEPPHVRFYAGAPLVMRDGHVLGALCVLDVAPRPEGLSDVQQGHLERLARHVVELLELRKALGERDRAIANSDRLRAARNTAEERRRKLYQIMDQGLIYATALRRDDGSVYDWRCEELNEAGSTLVGISKEHAEGCTVRELIPGLEENWVAGLAKVVDTRQPKHFTRQVGGLGQWYDGIAQWVSGDTFTLLFSEVTSRVLEQRRRDALLALGDVLRDAETVTDMTDRASHIIGEAVGASRATFGEMDHHRERVEVAAGWAVPGMPAIAGNYRFDDYGRVREYLIAGKPFAVTDVVDDPRTADEAGRWAALKARAVVNAPVRERGRTTAVLIVHKDTPHHWSEDEFAFLRNAADRVEIAIARRRDEEQQDVVNAEIAHRLKNALAMAQAIASQTLRGDASDDGLESFTLRLQALGSAHDALTAGRWKAATIGFVITGVLDGAGVRDRCSLSGPDLALGPRAALSLSLLIHELATNALKYGALSVPAGGVRVDWSLSGEGDACELCLAWTERGGPAPVAPTRKGFGSRLIRLGLIGTGGSTIRYEDAGLTAWFKAPLVQMEQA